MAEYFVVSNSFAAPICSDTSNEFVEGHSAKDALESYVKKYKHPFGLYSAQAYDSADDFHKNRNPQSNWRTDGPYDGEENKGHFLEA